MMVSSPQLHEAPRRLKFTNLAIVYTIVRINIGVEIPDVIFEVRVFDIKLFREGGILVNVLIVSMIF